MTQSERHVSTLVMFLSLPNTTTAIRCATRSLRVRGVAVSACTGIAFRMPAIFILSTIERVTKTYDRRHVGDALGALRVMRPLTIG